MKNSGALKTFATESRVALIEQMRGRLKQALTDQKTAAEYPADVAALRKAVDEHGEAWVADTAAYTWFNRLTAARYMDANGFSGIYGVVSPASGSASTLPEILLRAQGGEFSDEILPRTQTIVTDLLSGRRTSTDPDAEAYRLLLSDMFRSWHKPMPEVFPAAVDWIRLLTPADMLAPTSVRARAVAEMDIEACEDVEVVGWLYQFYISERKDEINDAKIPIDAAELPAVTQLFTPDWIVRYLVENSLGRLWLRSRPNSGLRDHMEYYVEPVEGQKDTGITVASAEEIRILDPACGSGHMLTYAFDLMFRIYEEEGYTPSSIPQLILTHNLRGLEIDARAAQLASFALAMKARTRDRRFFNRRDSGDRPVQPDIVWIQPLDFDDLETELIIGAVEPEDRGKLAELVHSFTDADTFGSLIRVDDEALELLIQVIGGYEESDADQQISREFEYLLLQKSVALGRQASALTDDKYHVVVANPPYLGYRDFSASFSTSLKARFPESYLDLCVAFVHRGCELTVSEGSLAIVAQKSWLFQSTYRKFRDFVLSSVSVASLLELGTGAFSTIKGEKVDVAAFVAEKGIAERLTTCVDLTSVRNSEKKQSLFLNSGPGSDVWRIFDQGRTRMMPGRAFIYWMSSGVSRAFDLGEPLSLRAEIKSGISTGDDDRFFRWWWEISLSRMGVDGGEGWKFCSTGEDQRRWSQIGKNVIRWSDSPDWRKESGLASIRNIDFQGVDGYSYRKNGSEFSVGATSDLSLFDDTARRIVPLRDEGIDFVAQLNSSVFQFFARSLCRGTSYTSGELLNLPFVRVDQSVFNVKVHELMDLYREDSKSLETANNFVANILVDEGLGDLAYHAKSVQVRVASLAVRAQVIESENNRFFSALYGLEDEVECSIPISRIPLIRNPYNRYALSDGAFRSEDEYCLLFRQDLARELISYAVGCMMGRYSLDKPGLILADAGATLADFEAKVPNARFRPDEDGIIPVTSEHYFPDDIVARLEEFLKVAFGPENLQANVEWLETALGSGKRKSLRQYFLKDFYDDHVKMYSKRPIYWQVSSNPKTEKGFNALIYLHRYTPATLGLVRETYANPMVDKQQARLDTIAHALPTAGKAEATKLTKERDDLTARQRELKEWITTRLFPLSTAEVDLDLDDGVKQNYPKLASVLRKVTGL